MDFSNDRKILDLSKLEAYYYVYANVLGFDRKEELGAGDEIVTLNSKMANKNLTEELAGSLKSAGIPCAIVGARKTINNFDKNGKTEKGGHDALIVVIDDDKHYTSGIFYADPLLDTKNNKSGTICHSLLKLETAEELLSKGGKYKIQDMSIESLKKQTEMLSEFNLAFPELEFDDLKENLMGDDKLKKRLFKIIEDFADDVYEMKAKDKSVNRVLHPYFGEGSMKYSEAVNKIFVQVFDRIFKVACDRQLNNLLYSLGVKNTKEYEEYFADAERDLKDAKMLVKIFSENYEGITPSVFKDVMLEAIEDGDYFIENTDCYNNYKYISDLERLLSNHEIMKQLAGDSFTTMPELEDVEEALLSALMAQGKSEKESRDLVEKIIFGSVLTASTSWNSNVENIEEVSPFGEVLSDMQKSKY